MSDNSSYNSAFTFDDDISDIGSVSSGSKQRYDAAFVASQYERVDKKKLIKEILKLKRQKPLYKLFWFSDSSPIPIILFVVFFVLLFLIIGMTIYGKNDIIYDEHFASKFLLDFLVFIILALLCFKLGSKFWGKSVLGWFTIVLAIFIPLRYFLMLANKRAKRRSIGVDVMWKKI